MLVFHLRLFALFQALAHPTYSTIRRGTDTTGRVGGMAYGVTAHHEIGMFVKHCGFRPIEALRSATSIPARRFGLTDRGRIQRGLRADLVLVKGNPMKDIRDTLNLRGVWKQGNLCSSYLSWN